MAEVSKYANIYAPGFTLLTVPAPDGQGYKNTGLADLARKNGMKVHSWTLRKDQLWPGFSSAEKALDAAFKDVKLDGLFSDFPDVVREYLEKKGLREKKENIQVDRPGKAG